MSHTNSTSHYSLPQFVGTDIPTWLGDFNSAMTAIDNGINSAATSASGAATTAAQALTDAAAAQESANDALEAANRCPFPVGFGGFFQTNPNTIYSGTTWAQKKDVFILAAGDTYAAGNTGGEAQHILTVAETPSHSHVERVGDGNSPQVLNYLKRVVPDGTASGAKIATEWATNLGENITTDSTGGSQPHNNMPPYFSMPFWIRTA
jgi:hypothetical protein